MVFGLWAFGPAQIVGDCQVGSLAKKGLGQRWEAQVGRAETAKLGVGGKALRVLPTCQALGMGLLGPSRVGVQRLATQPLATQEFVPNDWAGKRVGQTIGWVQL